MSDEMGGDVVARLSRLERECRRWRLVGAGAAVCGLAVLLVGAGDDPKEIRTGTVAAQSFHLVDEDNKLVGFLGSRAGAGYLQFTNAESDVMLGVGLFGGDPSVTLYDRDGEQRAGIGVDDKGKASVWLAGDDRQPRIVAEAPKDGKPLFRVSDPKIGTLFKVPR